MNTSLPIPAAQLRGRRTFSFAYSPDIEDVLERAELYRHPFLTTQGSGGAGELRAQAGPALAGHGVVLTSLRPELARVVNESPNAVTATFAGERLDLRPWEIWAMQTPRAF